ncbi:DUF2491 family protein [Falsiroseomonas sp. CW058]|uniref:DUF2491 family protein n=1 Tax=Falsiroseomonas sp. CW058 TaxID=3388664 RepID=UPI003D317506
MTGPRPRPHGRGRAGLRAGLIAFLLLWSVPAGLPAALVGTAFVATEAAAQARSSGGYSRPRSSGGYGRTPSTAGPRVTPRTPSTSGGYGRPRLETPAPARRPSVVVPSAPRSSAGDRGYSREESAGALARWRERQDAARRQAEAAARPPVPAPSPAPGGGWGLPFPRRGYETAPGAGRPPRPDWYRDRGWQPSGGILGARRNFGIWDGIFLWFLLDNLGRAGSIDFFRNHRDDPGLREWRAEADRLARDNADLRRRLDQLDADLARQPDAVPDPDYLPPGVPAEVAIAPRGDVRTPGTGATEEGGIGLWPVALIGGAGLVFLAWRRRRLAAPGGTPAQGDGRMMPPGSPLGSAGAMLRHKLSGEGYAPSLFRVGMTIGADPTPFILAAGVTKVPAPEGGGGNLLVNVQEVGRVEGGAAGLIRLRLPDGRSMFQLHLDAEGRPDECRFFGLIDEVTPADDAEWDVWLNREEGLIGWPEFQTKDGKVYARAWAPGETRIAPRELTETIEGLGGTRRVRSQAMLYAAPTGAPAPAPETEYILVAAVEAPGQAWVEIHAGIDINPAALSLA